MELELCLIFARHGEIAQKEAGVTFLQELQPCECPDADILII